MADNYARENTGCKNCKNAKNKTGTSGENVKTPMSKQSAAERKISDCGK
jgi:hypothetical protein